MIPILWACLQTTAARTVIFYTTDHHTFVSHKDSVAAKLSPLNGARIARIGIPMISFGLLAQYGDRSFLDLRHNSVPSFNYSYDDYIQYLPGVALYGMKAFGIEGRSSWGRMMTSHAFSVILTAATVNGLKYSTKVMRPDGSSRNSFPSGHTATAFMTATFMHKEYGLTRSPWYSVGAYSVATFTGISRQLNNRHWMSDIIGGALVGIISAELGYFFADLIFQDKGIVRRENYAPLPHRWHKPSFLGLYMGTNVMAGKYKAPDGISVKFANGANAGIEGALFLTPFMGIGGRLTASVSPVSIDGELSDGEIGIYSANAGAYFSYPFSARWLLGSKLLAGYNYYPRRTIENICFGGKGGANIGTGLSMTYIINPYFGMKAFSDYNLSSSVFSSGGRMQRTFTFGGGANIMF